MTDAIATSLSKVKPGDRKGFTDVLKDKVDQDVIDGLLKDDDAVGGKTDMAYLRGRIDADKKANKDVTKQESLMRSLEELEASRTSTEQKPATKEPTTPREWSDASSFKAPKTTLDQVAQGNGVINDSAPRPRRTSATSRLPRTRSRRTKTSSSPSTASSISRPSRVCRS